MSKNQGTLIGAAIRPNDSEDLIASAFAVEIKGGHHTYSLISQRNSIIEARREWGMTCAVYGESVESNNGTYQLKKGFNSNNIMDNLNWVRFVGVGSDGSGSPYWVDPVKSVESSQPVSPLDGDRYILGASPAGVQWSSFSEKDIVEWDSSKSIWVRTSPFDGLSLRVLSDDNSIYRYDSSSWIREACNQIVSISAASADSLAYTSSPSNVFSYRTDSIYMVQFATANAGAATLNMNSIGVKSIVKQTNGGLLPLVQGDLTTGVVYPMGYDGTQFFLSKPSSDPTFVKYRILPNETVNVPAYQEYLIYGDLEVYGKLNIDVDGKVVVINGALYVPSGGTVSNSHKVQLITLSGTIKKYSVVFYMEYDIDYDIVHNLGTDSFSVSVYDEDTGESVIVDVKKKSGFEDTTVVLRSTTTINNARVVIIG